MKKLLLLIVSAALLGGFTTTTFAADAAPAAPAKKQPAKPKTLPFNGKLAAKDTTAKTITIGKRTFDVSAATITKDGNPADINALTVGELVRGSYKTEGAQLIAVSVAQGKAEKK